MAKIGYGCRNACPKQTQKSLLIRSFIGTTMIKMSPKLQEEEK